MGGISFETTIWTVHDVIRRWPQLRMDPDYQREGSIWSLSRRQLFVDSILNGFDSPKIYLHELAPPEFAEESLIRYAVIDGQQRLEALRAFAAGEFRLGEDFVLLSDDSSSDYEPFDEDAAPASVFAANKFDDLQNSHGLLARRFFAYPLSVVLVSTDDIGYIEELFFRLNEGSPLTAAEKRNRGELLRTVVAEIKSHPGFRTFRTANRRGRHNDLAVRFMYLEEFDATTQRVPDMRARLLNDFTASFRPSTGSEFSDEQRLHAEGRLTELADAVQGVLDRMMEVFEEADPLLKLVGDILTYYVLFRTHPELSDRRDARPLFRDFFERASHLEGLDEENLSADELTVLDYFGAVQGTTTGSYLAARARLVYEFAQGQLQLRRSPGQDALPL